MTGPSARASNPGMHTQSWRREKSRGKDSLDLGKSTHRLQRLSPSTKVGLGIPGEEASGTALGVTAPNSGRQSGCNSWDIGLAMMA